MENINISSLTYNDIRWVISKKILHPFVMNDTKLSQRETECLACIILGMTAKEIARALEISPRTAESHLNSIKIKLGCYHRYQLVTKALVNNFPIYKFLQS
jgi:LuxR family transcriptional regulator, transcriptional regulator of spore coat protein